MRNFFPVVAIEFRRSPLFWLFPALLALGIYLTFSDIATGIGYWPNAIRATDTAVVILGALFAGLATWIGGREKRRDLGYLRTLSAKPGWVFPLAELAAIDAWITLTFAGIMVAVTIRVEVTNPTGSFPVAMPFAHWLGLLMFASLGYLIGRLLSKAFAPPLVAVAVYGIYVLDSQDQAWTLLDPMQDRIIDVFSAPRAGLYPAQVLWLAGLFGCFALAAMVLARRDWRVAIIGVAPVAAAAIGATVLLGYNTRYYASGGPEFTYACTDTTITICVHPAFRVALPDLHQRFDPLAERVDGTPAEFHRLEQRPRGIGEEASPGALALHLDNWSPPSIIDQAEAEFLDEFANVGACVDRLVTADSDAVFASVTASRDLNGLVGGWLAERDQGAVTDVSAEHDFLVGLDEDEGKAWLTEHYEAFTQCRLTPDDFR